jgi:hypothetical protein
MAGNCKQTSQDLVVLAYTVVLNPSVLGENLVLLVPDTSKHR